MNTFDYTKIGIDMSASYLKHGRGESLRSLDAKSDGKFPKTTFKKEYGLTPKLWKLLEDVYTPSEWHHTGKYANKTYFYCPQEAKLLWVEHYGYNTLPIGLKAVRSAEYSNYVNKKNTRAWFLKHGFKIFTQTSNKHRNIQDGILSLFMQTRFEEAGKLLRDFKGKMYLSTNILTGQISYQSSWGKSTNLSSKQNFYLSSYISCESKIK